MATVSNYALRLQASLMKAVKKLASEEGTTINQFINVAVAEKLSALATADYFSTRAARGSKKDFLAVLKKVGTEPPRKGDELP